MKATTSILLLFIALMCGCSKESPDDAPVSISRTPIDSESDAIYALKNYLVSQGENIDHDKITAKYADGEWNLLRWIAVYPENEGSSKFVPGGHAIYLVSTNGLLTRIIPGK